ncbi:histidine triad (HIT) family protein [Halogeometricum rufum]|uniref:Histidine triad (HIT) family protein n=1 Tax=Halogeometricum rufum TaxID=553469 RepID=A0A1I6G0Y1_9EURY|nr:HIT family protein [Halogeometricum rufum]SFR35822.1 histidine triad (HIT) family protein [Halogeometricum rufum]
MGECVLCDVAARDVHGRIIHETRETLAFLDPDPVAPGHTVVAPKDHYARLDDLPDDQTRDLFATVHALVGRVEDAVDADALTVGIDDGEAAGQDVLHLHVELIPRFDGDGGGPIHGVAGGRPDLSDEELDDIAGRIEG